MIINHKERVMKKDAKKPMKKEMPMKDMGKKKKMKDCK